METKEDVKANANMYVNRNGLMRRLLSRTVRSKGVAAQCRTRREGATMLMLTGDRKFVDLEVKDRFVIPCTNEHRIDCDTSSGLAVGEAVQKWEDAQWFTLTQEALRRFDPNQPMAINWVGAYVVTTRSPDAFALTHGFYPRESAVETPHFIGYTGGPVIEKPIAVLNYTDHEVGFGDQVLCIGDPLSHGTYVDYDFDVDIGDGYITTRLSLMILDTQTVEPIDL